MSSNSLTITDNRTHRTYTLPVENGTVRATDFRKIRAGEDDFGLMVYDPGFVNTASCKSSITFVDGERSILEFRGYPIEVLAERCTFLEVAYLLLFGELPDVAELKQWAYEITHHTMLHESTVKFMDGFRYDAHPMSMVVSTVAALSAVYPDSKNVQDPANRLLQIKRLIAKMPTITAWSYRHSVGFPYIYPDNDLSYTENFMNMLWKMVEPKYAANPTLARALDMLFLLHTDHEQNCSTNAMRAVGSSQADPYLAISAAAGALSGPLHGGANEQVIKMLKVIGSADNVPGYLRKAKEGKVRLPGFGHRVYENRDPRAEIMKRIAERVFEVTGRNPSFDVALELERAALEDKYFVERKLYPNVDYYSGIIYQAMGFEPELFTVLFAIPRCVGWLAQWDEMQRDAEQKIARPRQIYTGEHKRSFIPLEERTAAGVRKG
jgi:citrate synthase